MKLNAWLRDPFPKSSVGSGYLGDGYPMCAELPPQHFLRNGSKYRKVGDASTLGSKFDNGGAGGINIREHFEPSRNSSGLYAALCTPDDDRQCTFPSVVELPVTVPCDGEVECGADTLKNVRISDGVRTAYYEYVMPPCVQMTFFANPKRIQWGDHLHGGKQCADADVVGSAGVACCQPGDPDRQPNHTLLAWRTRRRRRCKRGRRRRCRRGRRCRCKCGVARVVPGAPGCYLCIVLDDSLTCACACACACACMCCVLLETLPYLSS